MIAAEPAGSRGQAGACSVAVGDFGLVVFFRAIPQCGATLFD